MQTELMPLSLTTLPVHRFYDMRSLGRSSAIFLVDFLRIEAKLHKSHQGGAKPIVVRKKEETSLSSSVPATVHDPMCLNIFQNPVTMQRELTAVSYI